MKTKLFAGVAAAAMLAASAVSAQTMATATTDLNVRAGPGPHYEVIGVIGVDEQPTILGCLEASQWCEVSYAGGEGWAYSDYLIAEYEGVEAVVTERRAEIGVPVVEYRPSGGGALAGGATGAVAGALIGGPVGAAVGAVAGAATGGYHRGRAGTRSALLCDREPGRARLSRWRGRGRRPGARDGGSPRDPELRVSICLREPAAGDRGAGYAPHRLYRALNRAIERA
jgi:uncharacterized protein YraI